MRSDTDTLRQKLEVLDGSRQLARRGQAAVRLDDLNGLFQIPDKLQAAKASGSVTVTDFNNLVEDVAMLHARLLAIVAALRARRGR
jgi:hypothetical protein